jgi:hypothetical protein
MAKLLPDLGWRTSSRRPTEVRCKESLEEKIVVARAIVLWSERGEGGDQ